MSRLDDILALPSLTHNLEQGSAAWDAFRLEHRGASEAAAALGLSKKVKRTELLHMKHTRVPREFSDWLQKNVLDNGHRVEALARPHVEAKIGQDLYPVTRSRGHISASCDGLTIDDAEAFEHKQWNEDLAEMVRAGVLPDEHAPQCQQILLVTGAQRLHFVVSDGTPDKMVMLTVEPDRGWWERIVAGWDQFDADLQAYEPAEIAERPAPEVKLALPALVIHAKGEITTSNMQEYGEALTKRLAEVRAIALVTDQDFSNAKESAKLLRENIQQAKLAKEQMLAQTVTVGEAAKMIDDWCEDMRKTALKLEQDVEREDRVKKAAMIGKTREVYEQHIEALKADTGGPWIVLPTPNWPEAIKNKRSYASMQDALDTMLANAKIAADESARKIRAALAALDHEAEGFEHLFADRLAFISKSPEDVRTLARARITEHRATEERRAAELAEQAREKIRREEQEKAEKEARDKLAAEQRAAQIEKARQAADDVIAATVLQDAVKATGSQPPATAANEAPAVSSQAANVVPMGSRPPKPMPPSTPPSLKLGEINRRIAPLSIDVAGLRALGFEAASRERSAVLFHEADFPYMVTAAIQHLVKVRDGDKAAA